MRGDRYALDTPAANGSGLSYPGKDLDKVWAQVDGTFTATITIQGRITPSGTWVTLDTTAVPKLVELPQHVFEYRVTTSGYATGTPTVNLCFFPRGD